MAESDVLDVLDELAETFKREASKHHPDALAGGGLWPAYHHVRAVAHLRGLHLSSCVGGRRVADEGA